MYRKPNVALLFVAATFVINFMNIKKNQTFFFMEAQYIFNKVDTAGRGIFEMEWKSLFMFIYSLRKHFNLETI